MIHLKYDTSKIVLLTLLVFVITGCFNNSNSASSIIIDQNIVVSNDDQIILGKKRKEPQTLQSMQEALDSIIQNRNQLGFFKTTITSPKLEANYLYVRFLPEGRLERDYIQRRDREVVLHPYPLDYEIVQEGSYYKDPNLPESIFAFYTSVPIDYAFTDTIAYEILDSLFLIEPLLSKLEKQQNLREGLAKVSNHQLANVLPNNIALANTLTAMNIDLEQLNRVSFYLTGDLEKVMHSYETNDYPALFKSSSINLDKVIAWGWPRRYRPKGTLKYNDTEFEESQPLEGVRVTAGYRLYWRSSVTNVNGYFVSPERWTLSVKYKLHWDNDHFVLQDPNGWTHRVSDGPTQKSDWNRIFYGKNGAYAAVFIAAYKYYHQNIDGLPRPRQDGWNGILSPRLDLELHDSDQNGSNCSSSSLGCHSGGAWNLGERIEIRLKNSIGYMNSDDLYGTTVHELAHSAHLENTRVATYVWDWDDVETKVRESYAVGVEWWLTKKRYDGYVPSYKGSLLNGLIIINREAYTGIIQDLVDTNSSYSNRLFIGMDKIRNFTVQQINNAFMGSMSFEEVRNHIISLAQNEIDIIKNQINSQINTYIDDYNHYSFDSYNQSLFTNLKNRLLEEGKYIDLPSVNILVSDNLVAQIESIYTNYFLNMNTLFDYWRDI